MVWGAFSVKGPSELVVMEGKQDPAKYISILNDALLPFIEKHDKNIIFQQDNAAIHTARVTKEWFSQHSVSVMKWPARSPDLNPIENLWGMMARDVYKDGKQYDTKNDLKNAIYDAWDKFSRETAVKLRDSMCNRCISVIERRGLKIDY